jgi:serine/threonine protein kinase
VSSRTAQTTPAPRPVGPGTQLGRYRILHHLARGGMADIYLARAVDVTAFTKDVVLKRILPELSARKGYLQMFLEEVRLAAQFHHPNLPQVYDAGMDAGCFFYTMEYVDGLDLLHILARASQHYCALPLPCALAIAMNVAAGLHAAHEQRSPTGAPIGIVHCDVTPHNVVVTTGGVAKLIDFGIARTNQHAPDATRGAFVRGKYAYLAPEQCLGTTVDRRADIFSLGTILFEMTTGKPPFRARSEYEYMCKIVRDDAPRPRDLVRNFPPALDAIIARAMARDRDVRYPTARALYEDLDSIARRHDYVVSQYEVADYLARLAAHAPVAPTPMSSSSERSPAPARGSVTVPGPNARQVKPTRRADSEADTLVSRRRWDARLAEGSDPQG